MRDYELIAGQPSDIAAGRKVSLSDWTIQSESDQQAIVSCAGKLRRDRQILAIQHQPSLNDDRRKQRGHGRVREFGVSSEHTIFPVRADIGYSKKGKAWACCERRCGRPIDLPDRDVNLPGGKAGLHVLPWPKLSALAIQKPSA